MRSVGCAGLLQSIRKNYLTESENLNQSSDLPALSSVKKYSAQK